MREKAVPLPLQEGSSSTACTPLYCASSGSRARKSASSGWMQVAPVAAALPCSLSRRFGSFCWGPVWWCQAVSVGAWDRHIADSSSRNGIDASQQAEPASIALG